MVEQLLQSLGVAALPGEKLQVEVGDRVRVRATVDYKGPAISDTFYGAIGNRTWYGFDEIIAGSVPVSFYQSYDWTTYELVVDIPVTAAISPGTDYDLYVKLLDHPGAGMPEVDNVIDVLGVVEFRNFTIASYEKV